MDIDVRWQSLRFGTLRLAAMTATLALGVAAAHAQSADQIYARLLDRPDDYQLNMAYGAAAEADPHSLRHAYAAYARAVLANPNDAAARAAYERVRQELLPPVTTVTATVGLS